MYRKQIQKNVFAAPRYIMSMVNVPNVLWFGKQLAWLKNGEESWLN